MASVEAPDVAWCSGEDDLTHRRVIGSGGNGAVHEVTGHIQQG